MNKAAKTTILLMVVTMISKILGFVREQVLSYYYGIGMEASAYITAMNIPTILFSAVGAALATTLIPLYIESEKVGGKEKANKFVNSVINSVVIVGGIVSILGLVYTEPMVKLFAYKFEGQELALTVKFTKIMISGVIFIGLSNIATACLQSKNNFIITGLTGFPYSIIIIISIVLSSNGKVDLLAYGSLIAMASQFLFQLPSLFKNGYRYDTKLDINDEYLKKMIWLLGPVFIGVAVNQINVLVDRNLASALGDGVIPALNYANRLNGFVQGLFTVSLGAVIFPILSKLSIDNNNEKFVESIVNSVNYFLIIMIPISVGAMVLAKPIVKIVFERGAFNANATELTSMCLMMYAVGMAAFGIRDILGKIFYSIQDTKTPMKNGILAVVMNIVLNLVLIQYIGYVGLPLATSIASIFSVLLLFKGLKNKIGYYGQDKIGKTVIKSILASIIMGLVTLFSYNKLIIMLPQGMIYECIVLMASVLIGAITYFIVAIVLRVKELENLSQLLNKKIKK